MRDFSDFQLFSGRLINWFVHKEKTFHNLIEIFSSLVELLQGVPARYVVLILLK
jgi:hypothetical protein